MPDNEVISPFLNDDVMRDCELKPDARMHLHESHKRGSITPQEISALFSPSIMKDRSKFTQSFQKLTRLLDALSIKVEIKVQVNHVHTHTHVHKIEQAPATESRTVQELTVPGAVAPGVQAPTPRSEAPWPGAKLQKEKRKPGRPPRIPEIGSVGEQLDEGSEISQDDSEPTPEALSRLESEELNETESVEADIPDHMVDRDNASGLNPFYRALQKYPLLPHQEMMGLFERYTDHGDLAAYKKLVCHNMRLCLKEARRHLNHGLDFDDLVQEGNVGLMLAVERFDYRRGFHFSTYAFWWIKQKINRAIADYGGTIRIPVHIQETKKKVWKTTEALMLELDREPTLEEIVARSGLTPTEVRSVLRYGNVSVCSLEDVVWESNTGEETTRGHLLADEVAISPDLFLVIKEERGQSKETLQTILATLRGLPLSDRHKDIFKAYYGLDGVSDDMTLALLGQKYGVTRERIRQMNSKTLEELGRAGINIDAEEITTLLTSFHELDKIATNTEEGAESSLDDVSDLTTPTFEGLFRIKNDFEHKIEAGPLVAQHILETVALAYGIQSKTLATRREWKYLWARNVTIYLILQDLKMSFQEVREFLDREVSWASYQNSLQIIRESQNVQQDIQKIRAAYSHLLPEAATQQNLRRIVLPEKSEAVDQSKVDELLTMVAKAYRLTVEQLKKEDRRKNIAWARHVACHVLRENLGLSYPEIGSIFGRDHTTVVHSCKLVKDTITKDAEVKEDMKMLCEACPSISLQASTETVPTPPAPRGDPMWETIVSVILQGVAAERGFTTDEIVGKSKKEDVSMPRHLAVYLFETDFKAVSDEVTKVFGIADYSTLWQLKRKIEVELKSDKLMQEQVARIRSRYTLSWYDSKLSNVKERQKILFPTQIVEARKILLTLEQQVVKVRTAVQNLDVPDRKKEIFFMKHGMDDGSLLARTLKEVGDKLKCTRERVRQLITPVWNILETIPDLELNTCVVLEEFLEVRKGWIDLIAQSEPSALKPEVASIPVLSLSPAPAALVAPPTKAVSLEMRIIDAVGKHYDVPTEVILCQSKAPTAVWARQVAYFLLVMKLNMSNAAMAELFHRSEKTIVKAFTEVELLMEDDKDVRKDIKSIRC